MSFSDVRVAALIAALTLSLSAAASAQASDNTHHLGLALGVGGATITAPNDQVGDVTLLDGSAFTGAAFRGALSYDHTLSGVFSVGGELGIGRYGMNGYSARDDRRREISFRTTSLDLLAALRLHTKAGAVRPTGAVLLGGRFGLSAKATERHIGYTTTDEGVAIATHNGFLIGGEVGVAIHTGNLRVPITFRALNDVTYGGDTESRLDGYRNVALPGDFRIEANWTYGLHVGVQLGF